MTLRERNRFITGFLIFSILTVALFVVLTVLGVTAGRARGPTLSSEAILSTPSVSRFWFVAPWDFRAILASIIFLTLSVPVVTFLMIVHFEKTQAQECVYFTLFLFSCLSESTRLFIPLLDLWESNATFLIAMTRLLLFGRLLAPAAFLFNALSAIPGQNRDTDRNALMLAALSGIIATLIPINITKVLPYCVVETGFPALFRTYQIFLFLLTLLALAVQLRQNGKEHLFLLAGVFTLFTGYLILINAASWLEFALGLLAFAGGVYVYLVNLHKTYL
jgi:hypothetical protein